MLLLSEIPLFDPSLPSQPPCYLGMYSEWSYLDELCTQVLFIFIVYIDPESHDCSLTLLSTWTAEIGRKGKRTKAYVRE